MLIKTCLAIGLWGMAVVGYLGGPALLWERVVALIAGPSLVLALPATDEFGFALAAVLIGQHLWRARRRRQAVAAS